MTRAKLLAHTQTKQDLTVFLGNKIIEQSMDKNIQTIVAYSNVVKSTTYPVDELASSQEEADTKLILHAHYAAKRGASKIDIFSPDTGVFVLAIHHYPVLCNNTNFVTGKGDKFRSISIRNIYNTIGCSRAAALLGFHAFSGADNTGCFFGKGKPSCWKVFEQADNSILHAFASLSSNTPILDTDVSELEHFVCKLYISTTKITTTDELRWWMFHRKKLSG